jgi:hypothetical protein
MDGIKFLKTTFEKGTNIPFIVLSNIGKCDKCPLHKRKICSKYQEVSIYCNKGQWEFCGIYKFYAKERIEFEKIEFSPVNQSGLTQT